jgi:hypothetical protein
LKNLQKKAEQAKFGEQEFQWKESTEENIKTTFLSLKKYLTEGQGGHVLGQMPKEVQEVFDFEHSSNFRKHKNI